MRRLWERRAVAAELGVQVELVERPEAELAQRNTPGEPLGMEVSQRAQEVVVALVGPQGMAELGAAPMSEAEEAAAMVEAARADRVVVQVLQLALVATMPAVLAAGLGAQQVPPMAPQDRQAAVVAAGKLAGTVVRVEQEMSGILRTDRVVAEVVPVQVEQAGRAVATEAEVREATPARVALKVLL